MKTLFLFVPNFVFSSDLLRTNYIKYLSTKYRVIVFSPIFKNSPPESYYQSGNIKYIPWTVDNGRFWLFWTKTLRISLIREFDRLEYFKLRRLTKINLNWKRKLLRAAGWFIPRPLLTADFFTWLEGKFLPDSENFKKMVEEYKPAAVLTCTPGFSSVEAEAIHMAKRAGLTTISINSSWDNYTSNAIQLRKTDYLICWNEVMRREAILIHNYPEDKVFVSGVYRFDHHFERPDKNTTREEFLRSKNLDPKLKTIFLSTVPQNTYPHQYKVWRQIIDMRKNKELTEDVNIFIRLHPNDKPEKYEEFRNVKNLHIDLAGKQLEDTSGRTRIEMSEEDLNNLRLSLKYTDLNANFRSSITLEETIYNKPVINLALYDYAIHYQMDHYIPILESGGIRLTKTRQELLKSANEYLANPSLDEKGRSKIFNDYIGFSDGLSYKRSVDALAKVV